jgi:hypothetical protein
MSKNQNMNFSDEPPTDIEQLLRNMQPEPLEVDRDTLFFAAGFAAGSRRNAVRFVWPSVAAALLLACTGLAVALHHKADALRTAVAAARQAETNAPTAGLADTTLVDKQIAAATQDSSRRVDLEESRFAASRSLDERLLRWRRLAYRDALPSDQLTARGWTESPLNRGAPEETTRSPAADGMPPRRPSTYLELLRRTQEG